jgi:hypothetical protein
VSIDELAGVQREARAFEQAGYLEHDVRRFVEHVVSGWRLSQLTEDVLRIAQELVAWVMTNGPSPTFTVELTWDGPLVHVEVRDRGAVMPNPNVARGDAEFAVRLLMPPAAEWGAELDTRGRCVWVALQLRIDAEH